MRTIHHVVEIKAPREEVYTALTTGKGLASWWTTQVNAATEVGGTTTFTFSGDFNPGMRITELTPPEAVRWQCVTGHEPWTNNTFDFELAPTDTGTRLRFWQHYALELPDDQYGIYNYNWGYYLDSLRMSCETGTGKPMDPNGES
ncbi:MAG TPA: SRPBCC domain-containing protein [Pseudonocardiaceae bacterium]|jgi:uncharacterized protein YndB with AHSA1/START domain|nr:SRPBCC domain-containing protein [Pseudonocardiaceae bacterium]